MKNSDLMLKVPTPSAAMNSFLGLGEGGVEGDVDMEGGGHGTDDQRGSSTSGHRAHSASDLAETLALRNVQLAQKSADLEELELQYRKLEKKLCALKLELADAKASR